MHLTASELLGHDGPIAARLRQQLGAYESRPQQIEMASAVARAMEQRGKLLVEAGTGVGKSFAYLVPAIARILEKGERVVVATATIALQEQLINKDIPTLQATIAQWGGGAGGEPSARFQLVPVLAKGRGNYLSIRRLELASRRQSELLFDDGSRRSLHVIEDWATQTTEGTLSTLPAIERGEVWDHVRSDTDNCMGRKCPHYKDCFYQKARKQLEQANLIICNHALFFSDLALKARGGSSGAPGSGGTGGGGGILPPYDHVVLDEAHNIEDAACEHFGLSIAQPRVTRLLRQLFSPKRRKGYLLERSLALADPDAVDRAMILVQQAELASADFFAGLYEHFQQAKSASGRLRRPGVIQNPLTPALSELSIRLLKIRQNIENEEDRFELNSYAKRAGEIAESAEVMIDQVMAEYVYWVEVERDRSGGGGGEDPFGGSGGGRFGPRVSLACSPVVVADILKKYLWDADSQARSGASEQSTAIPGPDAGDRFDASIERAMDEIRRGETSGGAPRDERESWEVDESVVAGSDAVPDQPAIGRPKSFVLTSATLATRTLRAGEHRERAETAFAHVLSTLGLSDATTLQLGSPFDYAKQAKVIIDLSVPNPREGPGAGGGGSGGGGESPYVRMLTARILRHVQTTGGGAFVLFTSFGTLHAAADACRAALDRLGFALFVQGRDGSRQAILKNFVETPDAVLFGAASFWQGVDVRGDRLRNVIITRLPFEPPDRPLTQARIERIELTGGNAFMQESLPRAIIRFKQGFGRLVRSAQDTGQVVVLDPRVKTARYGKMFLDALPPGVPIIVDELDDSDPFPAHDAF